MFSFIMGEEAKAKKGGCAETFLYKKEGRAGKEGENIIDDCNNSTTNTSPSA